MSIEAMSQPEPPPLPAASSEEMLRRLYGDPSTSFWLKEALRQALKRDPFDAVNDAIVLLDVLRCREREVIAQEEIDQMGGPG
jgi:hypothetical protein